MLSNQINQLKPNLILSLLVFLSLTNAAYAQRQQPFQFKAGDLIFQNLDCGPMCDAIEAVTQGVDSQQFSHMGLVFGDAKSLKVIEAVGVGVRAVPLDSFLLRSNHPHYVARLKPQYRKFNKKAIAFAKQQLGKPYDDAFIYNNEKYYCSELIYDAYKYANNSLPFFQLEPMTFKQPGSNDFFPVWINYYEKLGVPIPEGALGCNPGGISRSSKIEIVHKQ